VRKAEPYVLETVSHELNLHLLPWARVMMHKELLSLDSRVKVERYGQAQVDRVCTVLGYSGNLSDTAGRQRVLRDVRGDAVNKLLPVFTGKGYGNHADIGLWLLHLKTIAKLTTQEPEADRPAVVAAAMEKMLMPMVLTGPVEHAVARNPEVPAECDRVLDGFLQDYGPRVADPDSFSENLGKIRERLRKYAEAARDAQDRGHPAAYADPATFPPDRDVEEGENLAESDEEMSDEETSGDST
jgi:hypothetical protein